MNTLIDRSVKRPTILVVEGSVLVRMVISDYLRDCEYRVLEAASSDEALTILNDQSVEVNVVFTDIELPGSLDGFALARWVRAHRSGAEVALTGAINKTADIAADLCEHGPIVSKPYDKQIVLDRIKRHLAAASRKQSPVSK
jgi:CheY-like chemotaxis protein